MSEIGAEVTGGGNSLLGNTSNLDNLKVTIESKTDEIENNIEQVYTSLKSVMQKGDWTGDAAEAYYAKCDGKRPDIDKVIKFLNNYAALVGRVSSNLETLCEEVSKYCNEVK